MRQYDDLRFLNLWSKNIFSNSSSAPMAATVLSIVHSFYTKNNSSILYSQRSNSRTPPHGSTISCIIREQPIGFLDPEKKKDDQGKKLENKQLFTKINIGIEKLGRELKESLSPKQKGDWKDVMLMSLSFAVLVYISEKIVCAYCVWNSMSKSSW